MKNKILGLILALIFLASPAFAALNATCVWEFRGTNGSDSNGGSFDSSIASPGTDWSQQNSPQYALTNLTTSGAGAVILLASSAADMVGNGIRIVSGTNFTAGDYTIISESLGVSITLDRSCCTGVGASGVANIGGAKKDISANSFKTTVVDGNKIWIKENMTPAGGFFSATSGSYSNGMIKMEGYSSSRGDHPTSIAANQPIIAMSSNVFTSATNWAYSNIKFTTSATNGISAASQTDIYFLSCTLLGSNATSTNGVAVGGSARETFYDCDISNTSGIGLKNITRSRIINCRIHDSVEYFSSLGENTFIDTLMTGGSTASVSNNSDTIVHTTSFGATSPTGTFINTGANPGLFMMDTIIDGYSVGITSTADYGIGTLLKSNDFFNNTTNRTNVTADASDLALDPGFVSTSGGNFAIGANMKGAGLPTVFPGLSTTTSSIDIGAVQSVPSAGGGSYAFAK